MVEKMNQDEDEKSVLQNKLDDMTKLITRAGMLAGMHVLASKWPLASSYAEI
jgi:hypothetical protein